MATEWRSMNEQQKIPFEAMAREDGMRYARETEAYNLAKGSMVSQRPRRDPNAPRPKRQVTAFFWFMKLRRNELKQLYPGLSNAELTCVSAHDTV